MPADASAAKAVLDDIRAGAQPLLPSRLRKLPQLCRNGKPRDVGFIYRMFAHGAKRVDGVRLPLPYAVGPAGRFSTVEAVDRWLSELNGLALGPSPREATEAHERAERRLAACGI